MLAPERRHIAAEPRSRRITQCDYADPRQTGYEVRRRSSPARSSLDRDLRHLSTHLYLRLVDVLHFSNKLYYNSYEEDRRVTFTSYPEGNAPRRSGSGMKSRPA